MPVSLSLMEADGIIGRDWWRGTRSGRSSLHRLNLHCFALDGALANCLEALATSCSFEMVFEAELDGESQSKFGSRL